jgi:phosphoglycolate phosphatase-like HAD superfamily hydrolase
MVLRGLTLVTNILAILVFPFSPIEPFVPNRLQKKVIPRKLSMKTTQVDGVIFDIDGTLADSFRLGFDATRVVLKQNGLNDIDEQIYHDFTIFSTPERMARHAGVFPGDPNYEEISTRLGREFDDFYIGLVTIETAKFYPGILEMIKSIPSHIKVGALTNAANQYAHAVLRVNSDTNGDIYNRFSSIRGADDVPRPKPHPDGLWVVCQDLGGIDPQKCVYVGDSPSDGLAAKNAGMLAIGVLWGSHSEEKVREAPFDHICDSVETLCNLLPQIADDHDA